LSLPSPLSFCGFFFFFALVTGPRRSLSLKLSDTRVYEPQIRARLWSCHAVNKRCCPPPGRAMFVAPIVGALVAFAVQQVTKAPLPFG